MQTEHVPGEMWMWMCDGSWVVLVVVAWWPLPAPDYDGFTDRVRLLEIDGDGRVTVDSGPGNFLLEHGTMVKLSG